MSASRLFTRSAIVAFILTLLAQPALTGSFDSALHWRNIGPFRGSRTHAIASAPSQPNVFYMAPVNGSVFKSNDYGRTWRPIFDDQPTASVGAIAVSLSDPNVIYVGSGEGLHRPDLSVGDGIYKSIDAGMTWTHLGLRDGQQIAQLAIDPRTPDRLFIAVAGHPYGPNEERGIFRSVDGGRTFEKVLYRDENTGGGDVQIDPTNSNIVYATLWESRESPWEDATFNGTNGGIFKSFDGGETWRQLSKGLPDKIVQANIAVAPSSSNTLFAAVRTMHTSELYRSEDGGETWIVATDDPRPGAGIGDGDLPVVRFDPKNPRVIYSTSVVCWKSVDEGTTWDGWRGAPGGDDYQNIWINPDNPNVVLLGSDQGAIVTVNGGQTWSSWYNQPTAQMFHVSADNAFPYRLYSGQQESGSVGIASRGRDGVITFRDWHPVSAEEYGYVVADPLDPDMIYGGKLTRYDRRTGQAKDILPVPVQTPDFRMLRTAPVVFSPVDPHLLLFAGNTLWKSDDRGEDWQQISPDLSRKTYEVPASIGKYRTDPIAQPKQRGVIYAVAPSPVDGNRIWCGTDDGLIHLSVDGGKSWIDVTPSSISAWQKISIIEAGHFDADTAFAAVNTLRLDDLRPHIYRTHDAGKTWTEIVNGIEDEETVNAVREDTQRKHLLFAATEKGVYVSFNDGDSWESLRLNLPATSVRDLIVKDDDLAIGTHGRGFWILDNITPLRQLTKDQHTGLFRPQTALRVRWSLNTDTPLPPDEPAGENPPDGAIIDYFLAENATTPVTLEIKDGRGNLVRRYSSIDAPAFPHLKKLQIPNYWIRPPQPLSTQRGMHRFLWDLHYTPVAEVEPEYPIAAVYQNTPPTATAPWVMPGDYSVTLSVNGKSYTQPLTVNMDPRIKASKAELQEQFELSRQLYLLRPSLEPIGKSFDSMTEQVTKLKGQASDSSVAEKLDAFSEKLKELGPPHPRPGAPPSLYVLDSVRRLFDDLQAVDAGPTPAVRAAVAAIQLQAKSFPEQWNKIVAKDLPVLNEQLKAAGLTEIHLNETEQ